MAIVVELVVHLHHVAVTCGGEGAEVLCVDADDRGTDVFKDKSTRF